MASLCNLPGGGALGESHLICRCASGFQDAPARLFEGFGIMNRVLRMESTKERRRLRPAYGLNPMPRMRTCS